MGIWLLVMENKSLVIGQAISQLLRQDIAQILHSGKDLTIQDALKIAIGRSSNIGVSLLSGSSIFLMKSIELRYLDWHDPSYREDYEIFHLVQSGPKKDIDLGKYPLYSGVEVNTRYVNKVIPCVSRFWTDWEASL